MEKFYIWGLYEVALVKFSCWSLPVCVRNNKGLHYFVEGGVYCPPGCGAPVGLRITFRYLNYKTLRSPSCGAQSLQYYPRDMAPKPVTLKVQIYEATFHVTYSNAQRVIDLIEEFATMCKGDQKPCGKRRFFVCIYCGADWYSNKMMLNRHRFIDGCKNAKYPDGRLALLLPYPDLKTGEGKKVEFLSTENGTIEGGIGSKAEVRVPAFPQVPADLMWKEVQPEVVARGNGKKTKTSQEKVVQRRSYPKSTKSKPMSKGRPSPKKNIAVHIRAPKDLHMQRSLKESLEKHVSEERPSRSMRKASEAIACGNVMDVDDELDLPDAVEEVRLASTSALKVAVQGSSELDDIFHLSMRKPELERPTKHMKVTDGPLKEEVSFCKSNLQTVKKKRFQRFGIGFS